MLFPSTSTSTPLLTFHFFSPSNIHQIRALNSGTFGFVELCADRATGQQVAVKFIERGDKVRVEFFLSTYDFLRDPKKEEKNSKS